MDTDSPPPSESALAAVRDREHPACFVCGSTGSERGLRLRFRLAPAGADVVAEWLPPSWSIGYGGVVHGGLVATTLDSAAVHALFARGITAVTAELNIRYRHPVLPAAPCEISARLLERRGPVYRLEATLRQAGRVCARALARCMIPSTQHP